MTALPPAPALTLVFLDNAMVLSKRAFADWRAVQDHYPDYKSNLSPEQPAPLAEYLACDYPDMPEALGCSWPEVVAAFVASDAEDIALSRGDTWVCPC